MTQTIKRFSIENFENLTYSRQYEAAAKELTYLLGSLDEQYGNLPSLNINIPSSLFLHEDVDHHIISRLAGAITALFADPNFHLSSSGFMQLINWQRWISAIFSASAYVNADHVLRALNRSNNSDGGMEVAQSDFLKFCILYTSESDIPLDVELMWAQNKDIAACLFFALMSPRFLGTKSAHSKREVLLKWLPDRLSEISSIDVLPQAILHDVYMHCSYADFSGRHKIKSAINTLIRRKLKNLNLISDETVPTVDSASTQKTNATKPKMLVVLEWFSAAHSIYRTHSLAMEHAKKHFHLIGVGYENCVDEVGKSLFDEFQAFPNDQDLFGVLGFIKRFASEQDIRVLYMPSVGMFPVTMYLANMKVASLQIAGLGHPATTHSNAIDFISVEEDFVGDSSCFTEKLLVLPADGQPYRPSKLVPKISEVFKKTEKVRRIAIAATTMKLNPKFLEVCQKISNDLDGDVEFHFLVGQAKGLTYPQVQRLIRQFLGGKAKIYKHQPYAQYLETIQKCDMFMSPFPFGNTNGIVDAVTLGLPGVCLSGREVFEHIDEGLFKRIGLPEWCIAKNHEEYTAAVVRMAQSPEWIDEFKQTSLNTSRVDNLFKGRAEVFGEMIHGLLVN